LQDLENSARSQAKKKIKYFTRPGKDKVQKTVVEVLNRYKKQEVAKKAVPFLENDSEEILEQSQSGS